MCVYMSIYLYGKKPNRTRKNWNIMGSKYSLFFPLFVFFFFFFFFAFFGIFPRTAAVYRPPTSLEKRAMTVPTFFCFFSLFLLYFNYFIYDSLDPSRRYLSLTLVSATSTQFQTFVLWLASSNSPYSTRLILMLGKQNEGLIIIACTIPAFNKNKWFKIFTC